MRKALFLLILASVGILFAFNVTNAPNSPQDKPKLDIGAPGEVTAILENSCFGCHNDGSQNEKSKAKLNFSKWNDLDKIKKISGLNDIAEVIEEGTMPPQKFLANYPDKALTKEQGEVINKWIDDYSSQLMEE